MPYMYTRHYQAALLDALTHTCMNARTYIYTDTKIQRKIPVPQPRYGESGCSCSWRDPISTSTRTLHFTVSHQTMKKCTFNCQYQYLNKIYDVVIFKPCQDSSLMSTADLKKLPRRKWMKGSHEPPLERWLTQKITPEAKERLGVCGNIVVPAMANYACHCLSSMWPK